MQAKHSNTVVPANGMHEPGPIWQIHLEVLLVLHHFLNRLQHVLVRCRIDVLQRELVLRSCLLDGVPRTRGCLARYSDEIEMAVIPSPSVKRKVPVL